LWNQTNSILRSLGIQHGFYNVENAKECYYVDWALAIMEDLIVDLGGKLQLIIFSEEDIENIVAAQRKVNV